MNTTEILTVTRLKEILEYRQSTGVFTWIKKPHLLANNIKIGEQAGNLHHSGYRQIRVDGRLYQEHRLAWLYVYGEFPNGEQPFIDHIDGDRSNNRVNNLRPCSKSENSRNRKKNSNNTSGFTGVTWHAVAKSYCASVSNPLTKKQEHYRGFVTPEEASKFYEIKTREYSGLFYPDKLKNEENK